MPNLPRVVALCGYAQSGKDTVATILGAGYGYKRVAFADPLKALALESNPRFALFGETPAPLRSIVERYGWEFAKDRVPGVREYLQDLGVGVRRVIGEDTWLDIADRHIIKYEAVVVTDARFKNELDRLTRTHGAEVWEIRRPGTEPPNAHISEQEWQQWLVDNGGPNLIIENDGNVAQLQEGIVTIFEEGIAYGFA